MVTDRLVPLLKRSFPAVKVLPRPQVGPETLFQPVLLGFENLSPGLAEETYDFQASQAELGALFRRSFDDFPTEREPLLAPPDDLAYFTDMLRAQYPGKHLIGLSWASPNNILVGQFKSLSLDDMWPILRKPGVVFVSLQYGNVTDDIKRVSEETGATIIQVPGVDQLADMDRFAALVASLDAIITASNTTAHLAGAFNVPTAVLCPEGPGRLWYWHRERTDSPWYPSITLHRQASSLDWVKPISEVAEILPELG
jgi:hypothetical protein